jgi:hypothetical protein
MTKQVITALLISASVAMANHGTVNFNNVPPDAPVFDTDGTTRLAGTNFKVMLYGGAQGTSAASMTSFGNAMTFRTGGAAGFFSTASDPDGSERTITGLSSHGGVATVQVRAWDVRTGATWETATIRGASNIFDVDTANPTPPAETPTDLMGLQSFQLIVPEPTTIGLGILGLGALALRRRKVSA